jgi:dinuclear metal center YbgI/SA1388 family protein
MLSTDLKQFEVFTMSIDMYSISHYLAQLLESSSFDDVAMNGVQVEGDRRIRRVACAVTASLYAIDEACKKEADVLLVHHGLFLKNSFLGLQGLLRQRVGHLMRLGIHLLAYHLPLDAHVAFGNTWPQAQLLGMTDLQPFGDCNGRMIGVKGTLARPLSAKELYHVLQKHWGTQGIYLGNDDAKEVKTCAFVSGQGHGFLQEALDIGVDCFINGTVDERSWYIVRESGIQFMAFGHYITEKSGVQLLGQHLAQRYGIEYFFIDEQNPF